MRTEQTPIDAQINLEITKKFPTTPILAKQGRELFRQMLDTITPDAAVELSGKNWLKLLYLGITPEVGGRYPVVSLLSESAQEALRSFTDQFPDRLKLYEHPVSLENGKNVTSLVNIEAAERVILLNPSQFPPVAQKDPKAWLDEPLNNWFIPRDEIYDPEAESVIVRYGLLSGFDTHSAQNFVPYRKAMEEVKSAGGEDVHKEILEYIAQNLTRFADQADHVRKYLAENFPQIDKPARELIVKAHSVIFQDMGYVGFNYNQDQKYLRNIEKIYSESRISRFRKRSTTRRIQE